MEEQRTVWAYYLLLYGAVSGPPSQEGLSPPLWILHYPKADILVTECFILPYRLPKLVELSRVAILPYWLSKLVDLSSVAVVCILCHSNTLSRRYCNRCRGQHSHLYLRRRRRRHPRRGRRHHTQDHRQRRCHRHNLSSVAS